jgi:mannose-6-phosphate isomerase-like protein (cupin superfamily)
MAGPFFLYSGEMTNNLPKPVSRENAEHYAWGDGCDGYFLLKYPEAQVIEERMPPGTSEQAHWHERARQLFYVLEGELTMHFENGDVRLSRGASLEIEPGTIHQARNESSTDVRFLVVSVPPKPWRPEAGTDLNIG